MNEGGDEQMTVVLADLERDASENGATLMQTLGVKERGRGPISLTCFRVYTSPAGR